MAVYSMTGFAAAQADAAAPDSSPDVGLEIRTVNSRFLDIAFKMPDSLRQHEAELKKRISDRIKRGKVEVRIYSRRASTTAVRAPSAAVLAQLGAVQDQIMTWMPKARELSVADVLRLTSGPDEDYLPIAPQQLLGLLEQALRKLVSVREAEGTRLVKLLQENIAALRELVARAKPLVPRLVEQQRERFLQKWADAIGAANPAGATLEAANERALAEATAYAIRIDVAEELGRLVAHLDELQSMLEQGGDLGKRLDFMMQELHREANTLGSKSTSLELSRISMDMKVLIEQMREQVQNIE